MHGKVGDINIIIVGGVYPVYPPTPSPDYIYWEINVGIRTRIFNRDSPR